MSEPGGSSPHWLIAIAKRWLDESPERSVQALRERVFMALDIGGEGGLGEVIADGDPEEIAEQLPLYSSALADVPVHALRLFVEEWLSEEEEK